MSKEIAMDVTLTLQGPVIVGTSSAGSFGVDKAFERDLSGQPCIPKSLLKGRLREALDQISKYVPEFGIDQKDIASWFGSESQGNGANKPMPGKLVFSDLVCCQKYRNDTRTRITIDPQREAVKKGGYFTTEILFASGSQVPFQGEISFFGTQFEINKIEDAVKKGLSWIPALGGDKSSGSGLITDVEINITSREMPVPQKENAHAMVYDLVLEPQEPFCTGTKVEKNFFRTSDIISGGAIKGALANTLNHILGRKLGTEIDQNLPSPWKELGKNFHLIRICHAFPTKKNSPRPIQFPLTTVRAPTRDKSGKKTYDIAFCPEPGLINGAAPVFAIDWKSEDFKDVHTNDFSWPFELDRTFRVRTAIDPESRRAKDESLFAYELISPNGHEWKSRIYLNRIDENQRLPLSEQLQALMKYGLRYLGKTKVKTQVQMIPGKTTEPVSPIQDCFWVVTLQTPALMLEPCQELNRSRVDLEILHKAYKDYWAKVSEDKLNLVRFFASQDLMGGYLNHRFQNGKPYYPYIVTKEKSVFVLKPASTDSDGSDFILNWINCGLPLPFYINKEAKEDVWMRCPFVPENGFGEIQVNMETHIDRQPSNSEFKGVKVIS